MNIEDYDLFCIGEEVSEDAFNIDYVKFQEFYNGKNSFDLELRKKLYADYERIEALGYFDDEHKELFDKCQRVRREIIDKFNRDLLKYKNVKWIRTDVFVPLASAGTRSD